MTTVPESLFWYWIQERHAIYLRRQRGEPKPWTADPILQNYKFCNVFRELDAGTQWLRENFIQPHWHDDLGLLAFNCAWYRAFNWRGTGQLLGWQDHWYPEVVRNILSRELESGNQVFTGAHIIRSEFGRPKIDSIVGVCTDLYHMCLAAGALETCCREEKSLQVAFEGLLQVPYIGPFQAYEIVTDWRHTRLLNDANDIMTWCNIGPGAKRGLQRLNLSVTLESMRNLLARANMRHFGHEGLPEDFPLLEMRDIEHSLCELEKYARTKLGEGRPRSTYPGTP